MNFGISELPFLRFFIVILLFSIANLLLSPIHILESLTYKSRIFFSAVPISYAALISGIILPFNSTLDNDMLLKLASDALICPLKVDVLFAVKEPPIVVEPVTFKYPPIEEYPLVVKKSLVLTLFTLTTESVVKLPAPPFPLPERELPLKSTTPLQYTYPFIEISPPSM